MADLSPGPNSGGRIRTCDLRVMGPTSYQTALPRGHLHIFIQHNVNCSKPITTFSECWLQSHPICPAHICKKANGQTGHRRYYEELYESADGRQAGRLLCRYCTKHYSRRSSSLQLQHQQFYQAVKTLGQEPQEDNHAMFQNAAWALLMYVRHLWGRYPKRRAQLHLHISLQQESDQLQSYRRYNRLSSSLRPLITIRLQSFWSRICSSSTSCGACETSFSFSLVFAALPALLRAPFLAVLLPSL
jgi:hypothetical protein